MALRFLLFFFIVLAIEAYFLVAVRSFSKDFNPRARNVVRYAAYTLAALNFVSGIFSMAFPPTTWPAIPRFISAFLLILTICKLFGVLFMILDDLIRLFRLGYRLVGRAAGNGKPLRGRPIKRLKFLGQVAMTFTVIPAIGFFYGMVRGAYKYRVHRVRVPSSNLPEAFNGFRIVQLSDIHTGSFLGTDALERAFGIVSQLKADLILFTGDLVNNVADELEGFDKIFSSLKAPFGVYSVLGNHDYGDYVSWKSDEDKTGNLQRLKEKQAAWGWKLLVNEHVPVEKDGQKLALIGVENWGGSMHFPKYGKLDVAYAGAEGYPFKILMSHDPSHWEKQVSREFPGIDLTLSGHTHGMQMGIEIPGLKWSPVKYFYKYWAGLYRQGSQFLYVNRGLGFLGYPGRLGIWPEITVLELQKA